MNRKLIVVVAGIVCMGINVRAGEPSLGVHANLTWVGKYMAHGWNIADDQPTLQPCLTVDAIMPGLQFTAWTSFPIDRDFRRNDEMDYLLKYNRTLFAGKTWEANVHGYGDYWIYPHWPKPTDEDVRAGNTSEDLKGIKTHAGITFTRLLPVGPANLVPSYNFYHWSPEKAHAFASGHVSEIFLAYSLPLPSFIPEQKSQSLDMGASVNYHDGALGVESGWSHATAHLSTSLKVFGLIVAPGVNYQWSFEDTVDGEDEFWGALSVSHSF